MSIANLQEVPRFDWEIDDNHYYCIATKEGEWCKFVDAVEGSSNSIQQLKPKMPLLEEVQRAYCAIPGNEMTLSQEYYAIKFAYDYIYRSHK